MDAYLLSKDKIKAPPSSFIDRLKFLGPGFILSATIVGSRELIATTTLGAKAGFVTFRVILVSCLVKVAIHIQFAKHTIFTGETAMEAMNKLPGPRWGKASWSIYLYLCIMILKLFQLGGIIGGVALVLQMLVPAISVEVPCTAMAQTIYNKPFMAISEALPIPPILSSACPTVRPMQEEVCVGIRVLRQVLTMLGLSPR